MIPILTPAEAKAWDEAAEAAGRPLRMLMEVAGRTVANEICVQFDEVISDGVLVITGGGGNGGDGWVAARALHVRGVKVVVVEAATPAGGPAADARRVALEDGVRMIEAGERWPSVGVVVDAMLGTGARGAPQGDIATMIQWLRSLDIPRVAVDGPSGLDLETGIDHGALPASLTITFGGFRRGHLLARDLVGEVLVFDVGHPRPDPRLPVWVDPAWARSIVRPFAAGIHKGDRGRLAVVGGTPGMTGAARLAARSAFAAGAGVVHVVVPDQAVSDIALAEPDVLVSGHPFAAPLQDSLVGLLYRVDTVAIGPGLGRDPGRGEFVLAVLEHSRRALIDADALTVLAPHRKQLAKLAADRELLLTPHVGEFRTLFPECADGVATNPWDRAATAAELSGATVLLKGVPTVVAQTGVPSLSVTSGNPGLATGGSGDVLSGLAAAFLAQGIGAQEAGAVAAYLMGRAADRAALHHGTRGLRPMQVVSEIPTTWRELDGTVEDHELAFSLSLALGGFNRPTPE